MSYTYNIKNGLNKVKTRTSAFVSAAVLSAGALSFGLAMPMMASAAAETVVSPANTQGWAQDDTRLGGTTNYVADSTAPLGSSALQLKTDDTNTAKADYLHVAPANTKLSDVTELAYSTRQVAASAPSGDASFQLAVDVNGSAPGGFTTLVYEPYWQNDKNPDTAPVVANAWQSWDVDQGYFWSSKSVGGLTAGAGGPPLYTLAEVEQMNPDAVLQSYGVNVGSYNPNYTINVDKVVFNGTTYNFEYAAPAQVTGMTVYQNGQEIGCGAVTNERNVTVKWDADTASNFDHYQYQADAEQQAPYDYTTNVSSNQRSGVIRDQDGTYNYRVRAVDSNGTAGDWSSWCSVTLDRAAPVVAIANPTDGSTGQGTVDIRGTVTDANPDHYFLKISNESGQKIYGNTVYTDQSLTDQSLYQWDTTQVPDGTYTIDLEARDQAGNKTSASVDKVTVTVNNTVDNKKQCKDGGWANFTKPSFKNQGQCVAYANHHDGNGADDKHAHGRH